MHTACGDGLGCWRNSDRVRQHLWRQRGNEMWAAARQKCTEASIWNMQECVCAGCRRLCWAGEPTCEAGRTKHISGAESARAARRGILIPTHTALQMGRIARLGAGVAPR